MLVLTVEDEHRCCDVTQISDARRTTVDHRLRASLSGNPAGQYELLSVGWNSLTELCTQFIAKFEDAFDVSLVGPRPNYSRARPTTEQQIERVSEHRLSCPRLTREHVEPWRKP